jgi:uncharacterized membrane protein
MLGLAFLNPLLLWALPLAAVPIIIHLLNRRRFTRVPWAAMEFLLKAMKRNRKRLRMEQWLVLLLRVLAILLLFSLVSRPQLGGGGLLGTKTHHVVVLDDSASMTQRSGSTNLFEKAQDRVRLLADDLTQRRSGDLFSIVRTSNAGEPAMWAQRIGPDFGRRTGTLLKQIEVGDASPELGKALVATVARAKEVQDASRTEFYIVGDRRAFDWVTPDDKPRPALLQAFASLQAEREHVTVLPVGGQHQNLAVVDVRLQDRLAIAAVPLTLAVDVQNFGLDPTSPASVAIEVDEQSRVVQTVPQLAPGERVTVPVGHTFHQAGPHRIDVQLEPSEAFPFDDRRTLALDVRDKSRVLLVDGQPDEDEGEVFFVQATHDLPDAGFEAQVVTEFGLEEVNLDPFDLIWLCNVQAPTAAIAERIEQFVAAGGGLAITCGALIDAPRYNELWWRDGEGPLPLPIGEIDGVPDRPAGAVLSQPEHPICDGVAEVFDLLLGNVTQVKRWLQLVEPTAHGAAIVARIRDAEGPPLLATRTFGTGGEVALFAITADRFWSNLPSTDLFLVITHQLHRFAARRVDPSHQNVLSDGVYRVVLDPGLYRADATLRAMSGDDERTYTAEELPAAEGSADEQPAVPVARPLELVVPMRDLRALGAYEIELQRHDGVPDKRLFARNAPIDESRLIGFGEPAFLRAYPAEVHDRVTFVREDAGLGDAASEGEAWPLLAALLLAGLLLETLLAWRFGRR